MPCPKHAKVGSRYRTSAQPKFTPHKGCLPARTVMDREVPFLLKRSWTQSPRAFLRFLKSFFLFEKSSIKREKTTKKIAFFEKSFWLFNIFFFHCLITIHERHLLNKFKMKTLTFYCISTLYIFVIDRALWLLLS